MLEKLYILLWFILASAIAISYAGGLLSEKAAVVFGFILFGLIFMGMISVLPFWATHHQSKH